MRMRFTAPLFLGLLMTAQAANSAQAASFNCRRASTPDEIAICQTPQLSELDSVMAMFYRSLRRYTRRYNNAMGLQGQLKNGARAFLARRAACGANIPCLTSVYKERIQELLANWSQALE